MLDYRYGQNAWRNYRVQECTSVEVAIARRSGTEVQGSAGMLARAARSWTLGGSLVRNRTFSRTQSERDCWGLVLLCQSARVFTPRFTSNLKKLLQRLQLPQLSTSWASQRWLVTEQSCDPGWLDRNTALATMANDLVLGNRTLPIHTSWNQWTLRCSFRRIGGHGSRQSRAHPPAKHFKAKSWVYEQLQGDFRQLIVWLLSLRLRMQDDTKISPIIRQSKLVCNPGD